MDRGRAGQASAGQGRTKTGGKGKRSTDRHPKTDTGRQGLTDRQAPRDGNRQTGTDRDRQKQTGALYYNNFCVLPITRPGGFMLIQSVLKHANLDRPSLATNTPRHVKKS